MEVVRMVLVGKERFLNKEKSGYWYKVHYITEFTNAKVQAGCVGSFGKDVFVSEEAWYSIKPDDIGREFIFEYGSNEYGNPVVIGFRFANWFLVDSLREEFLKRVLPFFEVTGWKIR